MSGRAPYAVHSTGPRVHYAMNVATRSLGGVPFRSKRAAQAVVDRKNAEASGLIVCESAGCTAQFFLVPGRQFPRLCLGCSQDADRAANGWSPENSVD